MPHPYASVVQLQASQRANLESLLRAGTTPQALAFRCRIVLRAAGDDQPSNQDIAAEFRCNRHTVARWRERFLAKGFEGLQDAPRSGRPRSFSPRRTSFRPQPGQQQNR